MTPLFQLGQSILANQPFSQALETELKLLEPGSAVLVLKIQEQQKQHTASCMVALSHGTIIKAGD